MTGRSEEQQERNVGNFSGGERNFTRNELKIDPRSLMPVAKANDSHISYNDHTFYIDFAFLDPAIALDLVDTDQPLRKSLVARVALGPNGALELVQSLAMALARVDVKLTLVIDQQVVVNSDPASGPLRMP